MKLKYMLPLALAFAVNNAHAQGFNAHPLTVNLKATFEGETKIKETNNSTTFNVKFESEKISNKVILEALVAADDSVSAAMGDTIKGWSIVLVTDEDANVIGTFLQKKNQSLIDVSSLFSLNFNGPGVYSYKGKGTDDGYDETYTSINPATVNLAVYETFAEADGLVEIKGDFEYDDETDEETDLIKSVNLSSLSGFLAYGEDEDPEDLEQGDFVDEYAVISGSAKAGKGKSVELPIIIN